MPISSGIVIKWAEENSIGAAVIPSHIRAYVLWIKEHGEFTDTCTWPVLGDICDNCGCWRKKAVNDMR